MVNVLEDFIPIKQNEYLGIDNQELNHHRMMEFDLIFDAGIEIKKKSNFINPK